MFAINMLFGVIGGGVSAALLSMRQPKDRGIPLAIFLGVAVGIYVGYGLRDGHSDQAVLQALGALPFVAVAARWPRAVGLLGIAWLAHGLWDALHGFGLMRTTVPSWYPGACLGWDMVLGAVALRWAYASRGREAGTPRA